MAPSARRAPQQGTGELLRPAAALPSTTTFADGSVRVNVTNPASTVDVQKGVKDGLTEYLNERNRRG